MPWWITYPVILALLLAAELFYFHIADKFNIIDKPNLRSSHTRITLRGGGIVFLVGAWLYALFFGLHYPWFMAGLTAICIVSFIDDIHSVPNRWRLAIQFLSMLLMFIDIGIINAELWWIVIPALIVCVGIINAYNFMDGINGITGAYSLSVLIPLAILDEKLFFVEQSIIYVAALSLFVFCIFNFRKQAKCFAGDVGSVGIAFIILFILGRLIVMTGDVQYLLFLGVYGVDTVLTIVHRILLHENLGQAHRKHAYQIMANELHIPHTSVSSIYFTIQLIISAGLIILPDNLQWPYTIAVLIMLGLTYIIFMKKYYPLHAEYLRVKKLQTEK